MVMVMEVIIVMMTDEGEGDDGGDGHYGEDDDGSHNITMCNVEPMGLLLRRQFSSEPYTSLCIQNRWSLNNCLPKITFKFQNLVHLLEVSVIHPASIN